MEGRLPFYTASLVGEMTVQSQTAIRWRAKPPMRDHLNLNAIDLNLLPKFRALYRRRSVSEAGRELRLTQSAVSNALARMRSMFGDELFVRTTSGMEPTAFAHAIAEPIELALTKLEAEIAKAGGFEPQHSCRSFKIAMTQLGEAWLAPQIVANARALAPDIVVSAVHSSNRGFEAALASGNIDFAVGHLPEFEDAFHHTVIGMHELVCVVRDGHPILAGRVTMSALLSCTFAEVVEHGSMYGVLSRAIVRQARPDAMKYRTTNVMALPSIIAATDLVAILPAWFGARYAGPLGLRLLRLGGQPAIATVRLFWHPNLEQDPGHLWMRSVIAQAAGAAQINEALETAPIATVEESENVELVSS
jgi:DNA-binding transcriptional LysR family regulator